MVKNNGSPFVHEPYFPMPILDESLRLYNVLGVNTVGRVCLLRHLVFRLSLATWSTNDADKILLSNHICDF